MFHNLGVHLLKNPTGTFSFVGTLPAALGNLVPATTSDVMAGRAFKHETGLVTVKFPAFPSVDLAVTHAAERSVSLCKSPTCACRSMF